MQMDLCKQLVCKAGRLRALYLQSMWCTHVLRVAMGVPSIGSDHRYCVDITARQPCAICLRCSAISACGRFWC